MCEYLSVVEIEESLMLLLLEMICQSKRGGGENKKKTLMAYTSFVIGKHRLRCNGLSFVELSAPYTVPALSSSSLRILWGGDRI